MNSPLVTAVVCTRNRASFLKKCLASLCRQSTDDAKYEILVVDNGSTDSTSEVVKSFTDSPVRYVYEPVAGLSRARNTGWQNAHGSYVGYIDDDAVVEDSWIASVIWVFENISPAPDWVGGPIELEWELPGPDWIDQELRVPLGFINWGDEPRRLTRDERLGGGNSIYPKAILETLGGFDERLGRDGVSLLSGEETQLQKRVEARGGFLYYHPGIIIHHWVGKERIQPNWFYQRYFWGGVSDYFMNKTLSAQVCQNRANSRVDHRPAPESRWARVLKNIAYSVGLFGLQHQVIHARIYLAYVLGYLSGIYRWRLRKNG